MNVQNFNIEKIEISQSGYVLCKSSFYKILITLNEKTLCTLNKGVNLFYCEIDSNEVGINYIISMYDKIDKKTLFDEKVVHINSRKTDIGTLVKLSCYIDETNTLFSKRHTVKALIRRGLKYSKLPVSPEKIIELFKLSDRVDKKIKSNGSEKYRAMAAIAYAYGKDIFCFPWFSKKHFEYYEESMLFLFDVLKKENKIVFFPTSYVVG